MLSWFRSTAALALSQFRSTEHRAKSDAWAGGRGREEARNAATWSGRAGKAEWPGDSDQMHRLICRRFIEPSRDAIDAMGSLVAPCLGTRASTRAAPDVVAGDDLAQRVACQAEVLVKFSDDGPSTVSSAATTPPSAG